MKNNKKYIAIFACDMNFGIGINNDLLIKNKNDMQFFKNNTLNHTVIMGRKTFESMNCKKLKNRHNIILTRNPESNNQIDDDIEYLNLNQLLSKIKNEEFKTEKVFIIGGGEIYNLFFKLNIIDEVYMTLYDIVIDNADTFIEEDWIYKFEQIEKSETHDIHNIKYEFIKYHRLSEYNKRKLK